jgi:multisubunit Na+/H+ antiporter MnhB subunit
VERAYRQSTRALAAALLVLGIAMVVSSLARGGGALALGVVLGVAFALLGAARLYLASRSGPPRGEA